MSSPWTLFTCFLLLASDLNSFSQRITFLQCWYIKWVFKCLKYFPQKEQTSDFIINRKVVLLLWSTIYWVVVGGAQVKLILNSSYTWLCWHLCLFNYYLIILLLPDRKGREVTQKGGSPIVKLRENRWTHISVKISWLGRCVVHSRSRDLLENNQSFQK